ncbi:hypothetical protein CHUAL_005840 [Chamberlinius hualienensis]
MRFHCLALIVLIITAFLLLSTNSQESTSRRRSRIFRNYWNRRTNSTTTPQPRLTTDAEAEEVTEPTPSSEMSSKHGEIELIDSCNREPGCSWQCNGNSRGGQPTAVCSCQCKTLARSNQRANSRPQILTSRTN